MDKFRELEKDLKDLTSDRDRLIKEAKEIDLCIATAIENRLNNLHSSNKVRELKDKNRNLAISINILCELGRKMNDIFDEIEPIEMQIARIEHEIIMVKKRIDSTYDVYYDLSDYKETILKNGFLRSF